MLFSLVTVKNYFIFCVVMGGEGGLDCAVMGVGGGVLISSNMEEIAQQNQLPVGHSNASEWCQANLNYPIVLDMTKYWLILLPLALFSLPQHHGKVPGCCYILHCLHKMTSSHHSYRSLKTVEVGAGACELPRVLLSLARWCLFLVFIVLRYSQML